MKVFLLDTKENKLFDEIYKEIMFNTINNIAIGEKISTSFKDNWAIPDLAYYMIVTGESTGELAEMMAKVSVYYQEEHKNIINSLKSLIDPIMIIFLAIVVGGVVLSLAFGNKVFADFLEGAAEADITAKNEDLLQNPAMLDALIGVYERNVLGMGCTAVLPYSQALSRFPAHLQQLDMESNGKSVNRFGEPVNYVTGPIIFGEPGTNGQHSFYQLLHQGTDIIPLQFIGFKNNQCGMDVDIQGSSACSSPETMCGTFTEK